jgi:hypothetical protein
VTDLAKCVDVLRAVHEADGYPLNWPADPPRWLTARRLLQAWIAEDPEGTVVGHVALQHLAADWTTPDGRPVRLRHYVLNGRKA